MEYIINDSLDPYFNLALEEYLFNLDNQEIYFWLWQNDNTIVIGKNQNAFREIRADYVRDNSIKVARRITGGGAVYHDLGNLNFSFVVPTQGQKEYDFKRFTSQIAQALWAFGVEAEHSGRNDLLIKGKKFSGNAQFVGGRKILHHGTLLFSSNTAIIENCLNPADEKLKAHGVASVKSRITNICDHLGKTISLNVFKDELAKGICNDYDHTMIRRLTKAEQNAVTQLREKKFATYEWIYGYSPEFNYSKSIRYINCGTINLSMRLSASAIIEICRISGDFFGSGEVAELEGLLVGRKCSWHSIMAAFEHIDLAYYFGDVSCEEFMKLFNFS
ncbi:MAG: lipoate--protein ligase [Clostridiales bacterium]|nr:lipoate--protein ligase [Clostridiales bacterium]